MQKGVDVAAMADTAHISNSGLAGERRRQHRADLAAMSSDTNPDGVSLHGCLPTGGEERAAQEGLTLMASAITVASHWWGGARSAGGANPDGVSLHGCLPTGGGGRRRSRREGACMPAISVVLVPSWPPVASSAVAAAAVPPPEPALTRRGRRRGKRRRHHLWVDALFDRLALARQLLDRS